jgi:hypothetical protein
MLLPRKAVLSRVPFSHFLLPTIYFYCHINHYWAIAKDPLSANEAFRVRFWPALSLPMIAIARKHRVR